MTDQKGSSKSVESKTIWTPANIVTVIRICLVPVFVVIILSPWPEWFGIHDIITLQVKSYIAAGVFIVISCTDWIDGYLARSRNEVTDFGKFLDPLADKILVAAALIALVELSVIPAWPVIIILTREFIVSGIRMIAATKGVVIAASWYGKAKTVFQIIAIVLFIVKDHIYADTLQSVLDNPLYIISWIVMIIALILTVLSMLDYLSKSRVLLFPKAEGSAGKKSTIAVVKTADDGACSDLAIQIEELSKKAVEAATKSNLKIATAESLTGGMISSALVSVPGSSECMMGGVSSYSPSVKHKVLHVSEHLLDAKGAVNDDCAMQMAEGVAKELDANVTVAVTGIAGPTGEEPGKPVGTVYISTFVEGALEAHRMQYDGTRTEIRQQTTIDALKALISKIESL